MILGFKQKFPWGEPTYFREKILSSANRICEVDTNGKSHTWIYVHGINDPTPKFTHKIHTMRLDPHDRWKAGMSIQMVYRGPKYSILDHFNKGIPELDKCKSTQKIKIVWYTFHTKDLPVFTGKPSRTPGLMDFLTHRDPVVIIDGVQYPSGCSEVKQLARNDGFDSLEDFYKWFNKDWEGKIIHWSDYRY